MYNNVVCIDFGTTYLKLGIFKQEHIKIISDNYNNTIIPSIVSFLGYKKLIGYDAKLQINNNYNNTIINAKKFIGKKYNEINFIKDKNFWPFNIVNYNNEVKFKVKYKDEIVYISPEEACSIILSKIYNIAINYSKINIQNIIISVPIHFTNTDLYLIKNTKKLEDLNIKYISEPIASVIAYLFNKNTNYFKSLDFTNLEIQQNTKFEQSSILKKFKTPSIFLVFDLGGISLKITILKIKTTKNSPNIFKNIVSTSVDYIAGEMFTYRIVSHCIKNIETLYNINNIWDNISVLEKLRIECERAKHTLSTQLNTTITIDSLYQGINFSLYITRDIFNELCNDYFNVIMEATKKVVKKSKIKIKNIEKVILSGGSSNIPKIQNLLEGFFGTKKIDKSISPENSVIYGTFIYASILGNYTFPKISKLYILNKLILPQIIPMSISILFNNSELFNIIKENSTIPTIGTVNYIIQSCKKLPNSQNILNVEIYYGVSKLIENNIYLGTIFISDIDPEYNNYIIEGNTISINIQIDTNWICIITLKNLKTNTIIKTSLLTIPNIPEKKIQQMKKYAKRNKKKEEKQLTEYKKVYYIKQLCSEIVDSCVDNKTGNVNESKINSKMINVINCINDTPTLSRVEYEAKKDMKKYILT